MDELLNWIQPFWLYLWVAHLVTSFAMLGLILFVQVVHYPLKAYVGESTYTAYQGHHQARTTCIVAPLMLIEVVTGFVLAMTQPVGLSEGWLWVNLGLLAVIWLSTALIQVPLHGQLAQGFNAKIHQRLVQSNWVRTVAWALRTGLLVVMLVTQLSAASDVSFIQNNHEEIVMSEANNHCVVLLAHGSRDPRWKTPFEQLLANQSPQAVSDKQVLLAYMEMTTPTLEAVVADAVAAGKTRFTILPLFMAAGAHLANDVPRQMEALKSQHPGIEIEQLSPIGESPEVVAAMTAVIHRVVE